MDPKASIGARSVVCSGVLVAGHDEDVEIYPFDFDPELKLTFRTKIDNESEGTTTKISPIDKTNTEISWTGSFEQGRSGTSSTWRRFARKDDTIYYIRRSLHFIGNVSAFTIIVNYTVASEKSDAE